MDLPEPPPREQATLLLLCLHASKKLPTDIADLVVRHVHRDPYELAFYLSDLVPQHEDIDFEHFQGFSNATKEQVIRQVHKKCSVAVNAAVKELLLIPTPTHRKTRYVVTQTTYTAVRRYVKNANALHVFLTWLRKNKAMWKDTDLMFYSNNLLTVGHCFCMLCLKETHVYENFLRLLANWAGGLWYFYKQRDSLDTKLRLIFESILGGMFFE